MGRLPATFANQPIKDRFPYEMNGELALTSAQASTQFPDALFNNGTDKPFEVHRMIPRLYARGSNNVLLNPQPAQELLMGLVRLEINITNLEQKLTKSPTLVGTLVKGSAEMTWEFADPFYLIKSNNVTISAQAATFPTQAAIENLNNILVAVSFQGFFCIVAPPTANR